MLDNATESKTADPKLSENTTLADQARDLLSQSSCSHLLKDQHFTAMAQLEKADSQTLSCLYTNSAAGKTPEGDMNGRGIFLPGTSIGESISHFGDSIWGGKVFHPGMQLDNKVFGKQLFHAEVLRGPSWLDGKESTIVDYKDTSYLAGPIRDEIREVAPGLYLGLAYARLPFHNHALISYFGLETNPNAKK